MEINYHYQKLRKQRTREQWVEMAKDFNNGMPVSKIREKYRKPDGKKYARGSIYNIFKKLEKEKS